MQGLTIISGGQTGADQAGLDAALLLGLPTGGWLPKGCVTLDGPRFDFLAKYKMKECQQFGYKARTYKNVEFSDATVRFAADFFSPGEICTLNAVKHYGKEHFDIDIYSPPDHADFRRWLVDKGIEILNVAGNSEKTSPGIYTFVKTYLCTSLR